jgi:hypothetical protein
MDNLRDAIMRNWLNLLSEGAPYSGEAGAKLIARDFGYGLSVLSEREASNAIKASYGSLCVRIYLLKPPIDAREWSTEAWKGFHHGREQNK